LFTCCAPAGAQIALGKLNDFQDLTTQNWGQGPFSPVPSIVIANGGPTGSGDAFLENISTGNSGAGGRQALFNANDWVGNFTTTGVIRVDAQLVNLGQTALSMRIGIEDVNGTRYVSTNSVTLAADAQWHSLSFGVTPPDLSLDRGFESSDQALATVTAFRFMSASNPTFQGDVTASTLGIDNIHAVPEPGMGLLALMSAAGVSRRPRKI
jgi:hypothetical protein